MTISSTTRIAGPFVGTGSASVFPFTFKVFAASDLDVIRLNSSTGVETTLVLTTDYTVTLNGNQNTNPGGSVTLVAGALASGFTLTITSDIANLQPTDLTNQGGFYPEVITDSLDRATIQIQQMADDLTRSIKTPISDGLSLNMELPTAAQRANSFLAFDASGEPTTVTAGSSGAPATITRQVFSGTGSQTVFTLASDPGALGNSAQVYIGGVYQQRSTYTIAGTTLTFSSAPVAGTDNIEFVNFLTSSIGSTSADLVTYTPTGTSAVARSAASKFGETVSVRDFGAVGDGVTDDYLAFAAALATNKAVYVPAAANGYKIGSRLTLPTGTTIYGDWSKSTLVAATSLNGDWMFQITGSDVTVHGLKIDCSATSAGAGIFLFRTDLASLERVFVRDIETQAANAFAQDQSHATNIGVMWQFRNCVSRFHRGIGLAFQRAFAYLTLEDVTIDYVGSASRNHRAISIRNHQGAMLNRVDVTGGLVDATTTANDSFYFDTCIAVWMSTCMADTTGGVGYWFAGNCSYFYMNNCVSSLCGKQQFYIGNSGGVCEIFHINNCVAAGRSGLAYAPTYAGFEIVSGNRIQLTGTHSISNSGSGIATTNGTRLTVSGHRSDVNAAWGFDSTGTCSALITGSCFDSNTSGNVNLSSTLMHVAACQSSAGALLAVTGPGSA